MDKVKKIYVICPVRSATESDKVFIHAYVDSLTRMAKNSISIFNPLTDCIGNNEFEINFNNLERLKESDSVWVFYKSESTGVHFDLGMAFALNKHIGFIQFLSLGNNNSYEDFLMEMVGISPE